MIAVVPRRRYPIGTALNLLRKLIVMKSNMVASAFSFLQPVCQA